jgi:hypothetical protein
MLSAGRERRREDFEAVKRETGFDAVEVERVQRSADEAFAASEEEWALDDTEYVTSLRSATDDYLGVYRAEIGNGAIGALRIGFAKVAHDQAWADAEAKHAEKNKAIVAKWTYLQRLHDGMTATFAPKHVEARREAAREAFRNLPKLSGPLNGPPTVLPSKSTEAHNSRPREAHRQVRTTRTTSTTRTRSTVAAAPAASGDSSGSAPSGGTQGSASPASSTDDPDPPGRIRLAHTWHIAGISTAPAGSVVSFKAVTA